MTDEKAGNNLQIVGIDNVAQHDKAEHDARNKHGGKEQCFDEFLALEAEAVERIGGRKAQHQRDGGTGDGDDDGKLRRLNKGSHRQHFGVPFKGEALAGEDERLRLAEGGQGDDQQGADQKHVDQKGDQSKAEMLLHSGHAPIHR